MIIQKTKKNDDFTFTKTWVIKPDIYYKQIKTRIQLIEKISLLHLNSFPLIKHKSKQNLVIQTMPFIIKQPWHGADIKMIISKLNTLASDIDKMHKLGLIHGDIHPKNILFNGHKFILVDFEPYLHIINKGLHLFNITPPWISHYDYSRKQITFRTDRIGFFHSAYYILFGPKMVQNILWTFKQRKKHDFPIWDFISDAAIYRKNCQKILAYMITKFEKNIN